MWQIQSKGTPVRYVKRRATPPQSETLLTIAGTFVTDELEINFDAPAQNDTLETQIDGFGVFYEDDFVYQVGAESLDTVAGSVSAAFDSIFVDAPNQNETLATQGGTFTAANELINVDQTGTDSLDTISGTFTVANSP